MLMITSFSNPRVAQAFVDYMATQGIILTIQQHTQTDVWLADESQAGRVNDELARFLENPGDPRYLAASWQSGQTGSGLHYQPTFSVSRHPARARRTVYAAFDGSLHHRLHYYERGGRPERDDCPRMAVRSLPAI